MAHVIKVSGEVVKVEPKNGVDFSLEELKSFIGGGYIQVVPTDSNEFIVCDEEGKLKDFEINWKATQSYGHNLGLGDVLVGDIVIIDKNQIK